MTGESAYATSDINSSASKDIMVNSRSYGVLHTTETNNNNSMTMPT